MSPEGRARLGHAVVLGLSILVLGGGLLLDPGSDELLLDGRPVPAVCWLRHTELGECPGCGLTRSVVAFCHLRWRESWRLHPGGWLIAVLAAVQIPYRTACLMRVRLGARRSWVPLASRLALMAVVVAGVTRWAARHLVPLVFS
jgi:hypothetical protein